MDGTALGQTAVNAGPTVTVTPRYRVIRRLGGSGLGTVYLAEEVATGNQVAVKMLLNEVRPDVDLVKQFWWEARLAAASSPSHVVRVYEVDRTDEGRVFIAMEYLEGESLAEVIRREGALEPQRALRLAIQIAQGLAAASQAGVTHRNLKPQNVIVVGPDEQVKLTDFGIGRLRETALGGRLTRPSLIAPEYIAPEQLRGVDVSFRADIYALGAVLYTMLTGSAPAASGPGPAPGHPAQEPTPLRRLRPEVPDALEQFVMRAMEQRPDRRPGGIEEVIVGLRALAASITAVPEASAAAVPPPEPATEASETRPDELAPTGLLTLLREDPWQPRFAGMSRLGRSLWQSSLGGYERLRTGVANQRSSLYSWWSRRGRLVVIGAAALVVVGITTWAFLDWWSTGRAQGPSPVPSTTSLRDVENERRREEARAADTNLRRFVEAEGARRADEERRRRQAEAEAARRADEERRRRVEVEAARAPVETSRTLLARPVEPAPVRAQTPTLSTQELFRIRTQAQQKLYDRGLFRVSSDDRWGLTLEIGSTGDVILSGLLQDMALYNEAIRLVREVPGVREVQAANVSVANMATATPAGSDGETDKQ